MPAFSISVQNSKFGTIKFTKITTYSCVMKSWYTDDEIKKLDIQNMKFEVQIDKLEPTVIALKDGATFINLDIKQKHLITIRKDRK